MQKKFLIMVSDCNSNKYYNMTDNGDGTFTAEYGRVGKTSQKHVYPIKEWDKKYREKINKGYVDQSDLHITAVSSTADQNYKEISDKNVKCLVDTLLSMSAKTIRKNYRVTSDEVTPAMIDKAQMELNSLVGIKSPGEFNRVLLKLFAIIPRIMPNVNDFLAKDYSDFSEIICREQNLLDTMSGQVNVPSVKAADKKNSSVTILEAMELEMWQVDENVAQVIKRHMGDASCKFSKAYRIINRKTQEAYEKYCLERNIKETKMLFHGSKNQNWWNICTSGLLIKPTNVATNGSMFGNGIYLANKASKSIGYTSLRGSYWASGNADKAYLAVFDAAYGIPYNVTTWNNTFSSFDAKKLKAVASNLNCLHAHAGTNLKNDEIIFYNPNAVTIHYLIELKSWR